MSTNHQVNMPVLLKKLLTCQLSRQPRCGFTLIELLISVMAVLVLTALLVPALSTARDYSHREECAAKLSRIGTSMFHYLEANNQQFPAVPAQPAWRWGGVRFSSIDGSPFLDTNRPLSRWISPNPLTGAAADAFCCPADRGIGGDVGSPAGMGTGRRTVCQSFGTSYRANACLFDARVAGITDVPIGMRRAQILASPSRFLVLGDAGWYEHAESTGRSADWHGKPGFSNILFLDGSVRFREVRPRSESGPIVFDPIPPGMTPPPRSAQDRMQPTAEIHRGSR